VLKQTAASFFRQPIRRAKWLLKKVISKTPLVRGFVNRILIFTRGSGAPSSHLLGEGQSFFTVPFDRAIKDSRRYYEILEEAPLDIASAEEFIRQRSFPSDYLDFHHVRFAEQLSMYSWLCQRSPHAVRVLDISTMPYTTNMLKFFRSNTELVTIDLPESQGGPPKSRFEELGVEAHFEVDLNRADLGQLAFDATRLGKFDLIYASEVIEHVRFDFGKFLQFSLDCLASGGIVIVTTPNFHSEWKIGQVRQGLNPQHRFSGNNAEDGSYHYREYSMRELREHVEASGAFVVGEIFSWCLLEDEKYRSADELCHLRENMVFIFSNRKTSL
jgi:SAM-dependent methyltransferase